MSVDYLSGEFVTDTPGDYTVSTTSFSNGTLSSSCSFQVTNGGQAAFNGPHTIPGTIEAEFFDVGGPGVAYQDDNRRQGNTAFRPAERVDIVDKSNASNGLAVGYTRDGEFIEFTLSDVALGRYDVSLTYSSGSGTPGAVNVLIDNEFKLRFGDLQPTGGWNTFATTTVTNVAIQPGSVLRLSYVGSRFDLDKLTFTPTPAPRLTGPSVASTAVGIFPNPSTDGLFNVVLAEAGPVRITDMHGRQVQARWLPEGSSVLDIGRRPAGLYLLHTPSGAHKLVLR